MTSASSRSMDVTHVYGAALRRTGGTLAVEGLSIAIEEGEFAAVVGPVRLRQVHPDEARDRAAIPVKGTVQVAGAGRQRPVKIAGMAFQTPTLLPWRTTLDNVLLPLEIVEPHRSRLRRRQGRICRARAEALLDLGRPRAARATKFPWQLSGGMQQRASLCRALIHEPKLLMLDEPFGALDAFTREELWCVMRDLQAARKFTVFLSRTICARPCSSPTAFS